jgi:hypothetical protein
MFTIIPVLVRQLEIQTYFYTGIHSCLLKTWWTLIRTVRWRRLFLIPHMHSLMKYCDLEERNLFRDLYGFSRFVPVCVCMDVRVAVSWKVWRMLFILSFESLAVIDRQLDYGPQKPNSHFLKKALSILIKFHYYLYIGWVLFVTNKGLLYLFINFTNLWRAL